MSSVRSTRPYDTAATLARLVVRYAPRMVIALGDSVHDGDRPARLGDGDRGALQALQHGRDWIWITGNHDPEPADGIGGSFAGMLAIGNLVLRHRPTGADGEIAGHLHPVARVRGRGCTVSRRCFASDGARVFGTLVFTAHVLGEARLYAIAGVRCLPD